MNQAEDNFLPWFERREEKYNQQKAFLLTAGFRLNEERLRNEGVVQFDGRLEVIPERELIIEFPDVFPSVPPVVRDDGRAPLLERHQDAFTRHFCLFGIERRRWRASMGAAEALEETVELIRRFAPGSFIPEDDIVPEPLTPTIPTEVGLVAMIPPDVSADRITSQRQVSGSIILRHERSGSQATPGRVLALSLQLEGRTVNAIEPFRTWGDEAG